MSLKFINGRLFNVHSLLIFLDSLKILQKRGEMACFPEDKLLFIDFPLYLFVTKYYRPYMRIIFFSEIWMKS